MNNSFVLLSSMSPKINKTHKNKHFKKVPTLLALKKNIRRSTIFDDLPTTEKNESLLLIEGSTGSNTDSFSSVTEPNIINATPIVISDSDLSETDVALTRNSFQINNKLGQNNGGLSNSKFTAINDWVLKVNSESKNGQSLSNVKSETFDCATSDNTKETSSVDKTFGTMLENIAAKIKTATHNNSELINQYWDDKVSKSDIDKVFQDRNKKCDNSSSDDEHDSIIESGKNLLDELYGRKWRNAKDVILPKSEPRCKKEINLDVKKPPKTEVKQKSKYKHKNPYLDSEQCTPITNQINIRKSWTKRLESLCDSDTSEDTVNDIVKKYLKNTKTKLTFDDEQNDIKRNSSSNLSDASLNSSNIKLPRKKPFKKVQRNNLVRNMDMENFSDFSDQSETLEDKLRKKLVINNKVKPSYPVIKSNENNLNVIKDKKKKENKINKNIFPNKNPTKNIANDKVPPHSTPIVTTEKDILKKKQVKPTENNKNCYSNLIDLTSSTFSFLASLSKTVKSSQCDPAARIFRNNFKTYRDELTTKLFKLYNEKVFNNAIPDDTLLEWHDRMIRTAGYCYCKKIIRRTGIVERTIRIVLSTKVVDSADRLRDTLIHEMCHGATWLVNKISNGHGDYWKAWTAKARTVFPELPPINRCHDYIISTKYTYRCVDCGYCIGRHSKSLDIERKRCGHCYGKFEVLINKTNKDGQTTSVPVTPKKALTGFALYVKENYATFKTPQLNHGQVMKLLGQKFNELKVSIN